MSQQSTKHIFLVKPANFGFNNETAQSNAFQNTIKESNTSLNEVVLTEFNDFENTLISNGVNVIVFNDTSTPINPDAIFPNNWISLHENGKVIIYPMLAPNRRTEVNEDFINQIATCFKIKELVDLRHYESQNRFLEGTGSIVFNHKAKIAYACLSERTDKKIFEEVCEILGYQPISFKSVDSNNNPIYHTNVMMCIGTKFATICLESIKDNVEKEKVISSLKKSGLAIVDITYQQLKNFAGNMLELTNKDNNKIVALSQSAFNSLTNSQKQVIERNAKLLPLCIPTIETIGGGSARCMIAEIFLKKK